MEIIIDKLTEYDDYHEYCNLLKQLTTINADKVNPENFRIQLQTIKTNPFHQIWIAKSNGKIVGTSTIIIEPKFIHDLSYVAHIEDVVVDSKYRHQGIGSKLMDKMEQLAKMYNCYKLILDCSVENKIFYEKNGYIQKNIQMARYLE